ncbi:MAG TPA: hypothetical protein PLV45_05455 [bacterium]|nr:hypothetical protein [bacterium]
MDSMMTTDSGRHNESEVLSVSDQRKLDIAAHYINARANDAANSIIDIGKFLLAEFYDNDIARFYDRAPRKSVSLRKLASRDDINMTFVSLCYAVRLAIQERRFFSHNGNFRTLTPSHKVVLLQVESDGDKVHYAKEVIEKRLSVRRLRRMLIEDGVIAPRGPEPRCIGESSRPYMKLIRLVKPFSNLPHEVIDDIDPSKMPVRDRMALKRSALRARNQLDALIRHLTEKDTVQTTEQFK